MNETNKRSVLSRAFADWPRKVKYGYAACVLFAMVGTCAKPDSEMPVAAFIIISVCWTCTRIIDEAIRAFIESRKAPPVEPSA